jgi:hypothetical protein
MLNFTFLSDTIKVRSNMSQRIQNYISLYQALLSVDPADLLLIKGCLKQGWSRGLSFLPSHRWVLPLRENVVSATILGASIAKTWP